MNKLKLFLGAFVMVASSVFINAQVRSNTGNGVRSSGEKIEKADRAVRSTNSVRETTEPKVKVRYGHGVQNPRQNTVRNQSNTRSTRTTQSNASNPRIANSPTRRNSSNEKVRTVRVENLPKVRNFDRNTIRYESGSARRVIYHNNNNANFNHVTFNHNQYYLDNGYYYQYSNNRYMRVVAPVGFYLPTLPMGYTNIYIGGSQYYYYGGTYYNWHNGNYYVVQPPVGAIVYALPADYEKVYINGDRFYEYFGVLYQKVHYRGHRAYQVVGYLN